MLTGDPMPRPTTEKTIDESGPAPKRGPLERVVREWIVPLGVGVGVMGPLRSVIADWNDVPSGSMRPTILEGDRIYVNKLAFGLRIPFTHTWLSYWSLPH